MKYNKINAVQDELDCELEATSAKRLFSDVYKYMLYNDMKSFLLLLEYRKSIDTADKNREEYLFFRYMLHQMKEGHPQQLNKLTDCRYFNVAQHFKQPGRSRSA